MDRLPQELTDRSIDAVGADTQTLRNCRLVCRRWLRRSSKNLFVYTSFTIDGRQQSTEIARAIQTCGHVQQYLTRLRISGMTPAHWALVDALPRLRELSVMTWDDGADLRIRGESSPAGPATREIATLEVRHTPLYAVAWLLGRFASVDTLRLCSASHAGSPPVAAPRARHRVANLECEAPGAAELRYLSAALDRTALRGLTMDVSAAFDESDGHDGVVDGFVRDVGQRLRRYHHKNSMSGLYAPRLPSFTSCCPHLTSAAITTDAVHPADGAHGWNELITFLSSLPPGVRRITLVCVFVRGSDAEVTASLREADWATICQTLGRYALETLEVGVASMRTKKAKFKALAENKEAQAAVLERLPASLRSITSFL